MDELEFDEFVTFYYRSPAPERVPEAIRWYAATLQIDDPLSSEPMAYFFARLAQENPELIRAYEELVPDVGPAGEPFILEILRELKSKPPELINALDRTVRTATDNDLLWAEFMMTGSHDPILRLIDILDRPDKIREKLESWLTSDHPPFARFFRTDRRGRRMCEKLRTTTGIMCDLEHSRIETFDDLDCMCLMEGIDLASSDRFAEVRRLLPFHLTDEEIADMGVKATAKWSLAGSANRHPLVLSSCEREIARRDGHSRLALLEIAAAARLENDEREAASKWLRDYLNVNPERRDLGAKLVSIEARDQLDHLMLLTEANSSLIDNFELSDVEALTCAECTEAQHTHYSRGVLGIRKGPDYESAKDEPFMEWNIEYKSPSNYHVLQWMDPGDLDEWISLGRKSFQNAGIWFKRSDRRLKRINKLLSNSNWCEILRRDAPVSSTVRSRNDEHYLLFEYETDRFNKIFDHFPVELHLRGAKTQVYFWIEPSTSLLVKGEVILREVRGESGVFHFFYRQVFSGYNSEIVIDPPTINVAPSSMDMPVGTEVEFYEVRSKSELFGSNSNSNSE